MRKNAVKEKLAPGETVLGTMVFEFNSVGLPRAGISHLRSPAR